MSRKKEKNNRTKRLLKKIRTTSRERYLARLSLGGLKISNPTSEAGIKFKQQKMKNLEYTIETYSRVFDSTYNALLQMGVSSATIDDHLFYNWECRG